mmetsp:Transcript_19066/g.44275  ORF Transcript_19066/g.44275 Transcript_19066/m.44275 type:complete len:214 (-) Transcript_19066:313-954(-)
MARRTPSAGMALRLATGCLVLSGSWGFIRNSPGPLGGQRHIRAKADGGGSDGTSSPEKSGGFPNPLSWAVLRLKFTEPKFTSPLNYEKRAGAYTCQGCGAVLFDSSAKYESGSGWPAFLAPVEGGDVKLESPGKDMFGRSEVLCGKCDGHLGHVFPDGPRKELFAADGSWAEGTGRRYCINGAAMKFAPRETGASSRLSAEEQEQRDFERGGK